MKLIRKLFLCLISPLISFQIYSETPILCHDYLRDSQGNIIKETIYGYLSGEKLEGNQLEEYTISYEYSEDIPARLIYCREQNGKSCRYIDNIEKEGWKGEYIFENDQMILRSFSYFDKELRLVKTVIDDGQTFNPNDLDGISERHITTISFEGQEAKITRSYFDLNSQSEVVEQSDLLNYSDAGQLLQQISLDRQGSYFYGSLNQYDDQNHPLNSQDSTGNVRCFDLDQQGRLLFQSKGSLKQSLEPFKFYRTEQGMPLSSLDSYGNETHYQYNEKGQLIKVTQPFVLDKNDLAYRPSTYFVYDQAGRLISQTDANGFITTYKYTSRNTLSEICYPDNTTEIYTYTLDGQLKYFKDRKGLKTTYQYDTQGRLLEKEFFDRLGQSLWKIKNEYNAFHLISSTDPLGNCNYYHYNSSGQLQEQITHTSEAFLKKRYNYDTRGYLHTLLEWYGDADEDYSESIIDRDSTGQEVAIRHQTSNGEHLQRVKTPSHYDNKPIENIITNSLGQQVLETVLIDENGLHTITRFDALGRIEMIERLENQGSLIDRKEMRYDGVGNKTQEIFTYINGKGDSTSTITQWHYGPMNQIQKIIECFGTNLETIITFQYTQNSQLEKVIKADGIEINYKYDDAGRPFHIFSSDDSLNYTLTYDNLSRIIRVVDGHHSKVSTRNYNCNHNITFEQLANGLTLSNQFDLKGRRSGLDLPDGSHIEYRYDSLFLREVERLSPTLKKCFIHRYLQYDREGHLIQSQLLGRTGKLDFSWNRNGHLNSLTSPFWIAIAPEESLDNQGRLTHLLVSDLIGDTDVHFQYDNLGQIISEFAQEEHHYKYDTLGNRTWIDDNECEYNQLGQLLKQQGRSYSYDKNGNLIEKRGTTGVTSYSYDAFDRLVSVSKLDHFSIEYTYDVFHRRLTEKRFQWKDGHWQLDKTLRYLYDGDNEIGSFLEDEQTQELRVLGLGQGAEIGSSVAIELNGHLFAPLHDFFGSVIALINAETGELSEGYRYSAFARSNIYNKSTPSTIKSILGNPWQYSSKRLDEETGLIYFGRRYYDPEIGRWITRDPLGTKDGPNCYTYVHNNPINFRDLQGLLSVKNGWQTLVSSSDLIWNHLYNGCLNSASFLYQSLESLGINQADIKEFWHSNIGRQTFFMTGTYPETGISGCVGKGEISDKVRITYINGIMASSKDLISQSASLSAAHGNTNVHYIYGPTRGWTWDLVQGFLVKVFKRITPHAYCLASKWKALIEEMGGTDNGGTIIHFAHSIGGSDSHRAKELLTPEERKMIHILTFGSSTLIPNEGLKDVTNYVSVRDGVCYLDPIGYASALWNNSDHVDFLGSHFDGFPIVDHLFTCDTYRLVWEELGNEFVKKYGRIE